MDFSELHAAMRRWVDRDVLAGVSCALLKGREVVDLHCEGMADREAGITLRPDHVFRLFSNTKLVTSCAVMMLVEDGRIALDDPVDRWLPALANRRVLRPGAERLDDTEPAVRPISVRHLLSHSSGLSYGLLDPGTPMFKAYTARRVLSHLTTLEQMVEQLADLPLLFQPGTWWEYSIATDVLGRLVEVVSGQPFDAFLAERIFRPAGMRDTGFHLRPDDASRLVAFYAGVDMFDPVKPGLVRNDNAPYPGAYRSPAPRLSGGGGLVGTLGDMVALMQALMPGPGRLLSDASMAALATNQLPDGVTIGFPLLGRTPGKGYGLGGAVTLATTSLDPPGSEGELQWGGIAGTHWWISPRHGVAGVIMAQRHMGFWNPYFFDLKGAAYRGMGLG